MHPSILRVPGPNVNHAHMGTSLYRRVKQVAETVLPHPVLDVESVRDAIRQRSLSLSCLGLAHLADSRKPRPSI